MSKRFSQRVLPALLALLALLPAAASAQYSSQQTTLSSATCPGSGCLPFGVLGQASASVQATSASGTWTGVVEGTITGETWNTLEVQKADGTGSSTTFNAAGLYKVSLGVGGYTAIRVRLSAYTSGAVTVTIGTAASGGGGGGSATVSGTFSGNAAASATAGSVPASADYQGINIGGNLAGVSGKLVGATNAMAVAIVDGSGAQITSFGGGGGGTLTSDPDDASIAGAQTNSNVNALTMAFDGSVWRRLTFGTAGTASAQVLTVQGISGGTALPVSLASLPALATGTNSIGSVTQATAANLNAAVVGNSAAGAADSGNPVKIAGVYNSALPTLTTGQRGNVQLDSSSRLLVNCANCSGTGVSVNEDAASANGDPGTPAYSVRQDTISTTSSADGDYQPLKTTAAGRLYTSSTIDAALPTGTNSIGAVTQATASNFNAAVVGNVASAATDSGNPVKVAGVYNSSAPTFTNGQRGNLQIASNGDLKVIATGAATESTVANYLPNIAAATAVNNTEHDAASGGKKVIIVDASGNVLSPGVVCESSIAIDASASGNTELVGLTSSQTIHVCGFYVISGGTVTAKFVSGTGTACGTGTANVTGPAPLIANSGASYGGGAGQVFAAPTSEALCINLSGAVAVGGVLSYSKY